tara:strand:+ start:3125 stop:3400 length:276 start_codon:yes stop_codon:yes gene_type:complete
MTNIKHLIHRTLDIGSGFLLSILIQYIVFPFFDIYIDVSEMIHLALIFTVIGILRSYLWSKYVFKYGESKSESIKQKWKEENLGVRDYTNE